MFLSKLGFVILPLKTKVIVKIRLELNKILKIKKN